MHIFTLFQCYCPSSWVFLLSLNIMYFMVRHLKAFMYTEKLSKCAQNTANIVQKMFPNALHTKTTKINVNAGFLHC